MLVIMDMKWDKKGGRVFPTQLSAVRVLPGWVEQARFDSIMQPLMNPDWSRMAYNGYSLDEFLIAPTAASVFNRFTQWLSPKDVLCWWASIPAITFITLYRIILKQPPTNSMRLIAPVVFQKMKPCSFPENTSIYDLKNTLNISHNGTEYCSYNDVDLIRNILKRQMILESDILQIYLPPHSYDHDIWNIHEKKSAPQKHTIELNYAIDPSKNLVHTRDCPKVGHGKQLVFVPLIKHCMKKQLRPCKCCKEAFWEYSIEAAKEIIKKCGYNYIFSDSGLFHRPSCLHVKHIPSVDITVAVHYKTAVKNGYKPCGWCKPNSTAENANSLITDNHTLSSDVSSINKPEKYFEGNSPYARKQRALVREKASYNSTRELSQAELNAIRRHTQAAHERALLPYGLVGIADHDAHVLSQSGYAFWSAKGYQTFHLRQCPKLVHLSELSGYATYADARKRGLTPCRVCKPTAKDDITVSVPIYQHRRETESITDLDHLCDRLGWRHVYSSQEYIIETAVGKWKIIHGTSPVDVYHINKVKTPDNQTDYHRQHRLFLSMTDTLEYIKRHDRKLLEIVAEDIPDNLLLDENLPEID